MKNDILMMPYPESGALYVHNLAEELNKEHFRVRKPIRFNKLPYLFPIMRNVLKYRVKLIHLHWIEGYSGLSAKNIFLCIFKFFLFIIDTLVAKFILKVKIVWTIHNLYSHEIYFPKIEKISRKYFSRMSNAIICHCSDAKKLLQKEFSVVQDKIYIVNIGNYQNSYKNEITLEKARQSLKYKKEDFIFLIFGPLRPYKGILNLIKNFNELETIQHAKLLIVGKPESSLFKKHIEKAVIDNKNINLICRFIPDDEIQIFMNASDLSVFSYNKILTSAGILLAMNFRKAIIAPKLGCIPETIDQKGAFLYDSKDSYGLINALKKAMKNKNKLLEMGNYNFELAKNFEWNNIARQNKEVYERYLK